MLSIVERARTITINKIEKTITLTYHRDVDSFMSFADVPLSMVNYIAFMLHEKQPSTVMQVGLTSKKHCLGKASSLKLRNVYITGAMEVHEALCATYSELMSRPPYSLEIHPRVVPAKPKRRDPKRSICDWY